MSFNKKYGNQPTLLNYVRDNVSISNSTPPAPVSSQYAIFGQTSPQTGIVANSNTAINWDTLVTNTIPGLNLSGKQIQNTSLNTMVLLVTFNISWKDGPSLINCWINKQQTSADPENPANLVTFITGEVLLSNNPSSTTIVSATTTSIVQLEPGQSINTCIYTDVNTKTVVTWNPRVNIVRIV